MVDLMLENTRHQACQAQFIVLSLEILEGSHDLYRSLYQTHVIIITDAPLPRQAQIRRVINDTRIEYRLEIAILLWSVPVLPLAHDEQIDLGFAYLGRSYTHTFARPESCSTPQ